MLTLQCDDTFQDHNSTNSFAVYMPDSVCHSPYHHSSTRTSSEGQRSGPPSEYALPASPNDTLPRSVAMSMSHPPPGPPPGPPAGRQVRALYGHLADQESQLSFSMGDAITLMGDAADGWQFGHNSRTGQYGWFPLSFTDSYESRHQLQTQTPMRFRQRAKSFSEMNGDARSLSEFSGWSHDHYMPGTTHRPRSLHESSLHNAPSLPQLHSGDGLPQFFTSSTTAHPASNVIFTLGSRSQPASRAPSRPPSPPLPPPPPQLVQASEPPPQPPAKVPPPTLSRRPSSKSVHRADTLPVGIHAPPPPTGSAPMPPSHLPSSPAQASVVPTTSNVAMLASSLRNVVGQISAASGQSGRGLPTVPPRHVAGDHQQEPLPPPPPPATAAAPPPPAPPAPPPPPPPGNPFTNVTLKRTKTNDRSAPKI
ncbi:hypothetical protein V1264_010893 [Littorina saxatilis]|uniref:SH3 domain-containing protein n=1 Tax=Littorina saxatilis TaxID=31220 RepID=A0AAN9BRG9_9CAEN